VPKLEVWAMQRESKLATREAAPKSLWDEFDRIFANFRTGLEDFFPRFGGLSTWAGGGTRAALVDVRDNGRDFVVQAELPGVQKEDLDIDVTPEGLEIKAQRRREQEEKEQGYYYRERAYDSWYRRLQFPAEVLPDKTEAELRDGVLTVTVPKKEPTPEKKPRKVRVK
jgi:HSP20 family protein